MTSTVDPTVDHSQWRKGGRNRGSLDRAWAFAKNLVLDEAGASAVEYALLISGIAGVVVAIVFSLGIQVKGLFGPTCKVLNNNADC